MSFADLLDCSAYCPDTGREGEIVSVSGGRYQSVEVGVRWADGSFSVVAAATVVLG